MEFAEMLDRYTRAAYSWRGHVINQTSVLEGVINLYIAAHFCKEEPLKKELIELIIATERINLESKRQIFKHLVEKYHGDFAKNNTKIFTQVHKMLEERNIFAHYQLDTSVDAVKKYFDEHAITFISYKTTIKLVIYTQSRVQEIVDLITDCILKINDLNQMIKEQK